MAHAPGVPRHNHVNASPLRKTAVAIFVGRPRWGFYRSTRATLRTPGIRLAHPANLAYLRVVTSEQRTSLAGVVSVDPGIMHGTPCFTGTRVPVQTLLDYIEDGDTLDNFLRDFTTVKREQAISFLELAKDQLIECVSS